MAELTREEVGQIIKAAWMKGKRPDFQGMDLSQVNLRNVNLFEANLSKTNLQETVLFEADLRKANLHSADLHGADLNKADLRQANLSNTNLCGTILRGADLSRANLLCSDLRGADLTRANLNQVNLNKVNLGKTKAVFTIFGGIDLRKVQGLYTINHLGPSVVDTHSLQLSEGNIPAVFLRGCGLTDLQIEMAKLHNPNLTPKQVTVITDRIRELTADHTVLQFHSCFISYAGQDEAFVKRLHADLQQKGVRCWLALEDMKIGDKIRPTIDQSIRLHDKLLIILSENSLNSFWVESEVEKAFEEERQRNQTVLFPVRLDETVMETDKAWAAEIRRTRHIGDFTRWKDPDAYQQAFERLLRDLKAGG